MPFISVIVPTMRVGGIDILLDSLAKQTFTDFELVLVDALCDHRKDRVREEARDRFLCVKHVGPQPSPFPMCSFCLMSNCGIAVSTGEVLLFAVDYTAFPPDLLERHARFHKADPSGKGGLMGPHRYLHLNPAEGFPIYDRGDVDRYEADVLAGRLDAFMISAGRHGNAHGAESEPHQADGGAIVPFDADPKLRMPPGPIGPEFFHAKNESVRRERVLEIDGYDQDLDGAHLYQDSDFADRLTKKAGVRWLLDPKAVTEIVNPRHMFPFARRVRPHEANKAIWEKKRDAGYPDRPSSVLVGLKMKEREISVDHAPPPVIDTQPVEVTRAPLRIAMIYGEFSSAIHGPFDIDGLYTKTGLTGSESSFFNLARSLAERGHELVVFCDTPREADHQSGFKAMPMHTLSMFPRVQGVSAVLAWNEPDYLQFAPPGALRICDQQLNDFGYAGSPWYKQAGKWLAPHTTPRWRELVDVWVSPSKNHQQNVMGGLPGKHVVIPNSVDLGLFDGDAPARDRNRVVWCSSPDRGLHHLLSFWPDVRIRLPRAELHVFYRLAPWLAGARGNPDEVGRRARYIEHALERLRRHGVFVHDNVPNARMARELQAAACLAYPCDPVRYTEGFGCSVLDAAAGGCIPIISAADALPEVHGRAVMGLPGPPQDQRQAWVEAIVACMEGRVDRVASQRMREHAELHARERIADRWEALLPSP